MVSNRKAEESGNALVERAKRKKIEREIAPTTEDLPNPLGLYAPRNNGLLSARYHDQFRRAAKARKKRGGRPAAILMQFLAEDPYTFHTSDWVLAAVGQVVLGKVNDAKAAKKFFLWYWRSVPRRKSPKAKKFQQAWKAHLFDLRHRHEIV